MRRAFLAAAAVAVLCSPLSASAASLTSAQAEAVINLIAAFGGDAATIANVRAALGGGAAAAAGTLAFAPAALAADKRVARGTDDAPFGAVTLMNHTGGNVTLYTVTLERAGTAADSSFEEISLASNGAPVATAAELDSRHQATLAPGLTIAAGHTLTLTLAGDVASSARRGKSLGLTVVAINASSPVSGSLPIEGLVRTID